MEFRILGNSKRDMWRLNPKDRACIVQVWTIRSDDNIVATFASTGKVLVVAAVQKAAETLASSTANAQLLLPSVVAETLLWNNGSILMNVTPFTPFKRSRCDGKGRRGGRRVCSTSGTCLVCPCILRQGFG